MRVANGFMIEADGGARVAYIIAHTQLREEAEEHAQRVRRMNHLQMR